MKCTDAVLGIPHSSVPSNTFYQHISATTPEPIRARHLLIWCTKRATDAALAPPAKSKSKGKGRDETPRTEEGDKLLKDIMDDLMAKLGKGVVDTNIFQQGVSRPIFSFLSAQLWDLADRCRMQVVQACRYVLIRRMSQIGRSNAKNRKSSGGMYMSPS